MSSSSSPDQSFIGPLPYGKLCIISYVAPEEMFDYYGDDVCHIYIVDLDTDDDNDLCRMVPVLCIAADCHWPLNFCLLDLDLYMIERRSNLINHGGRGKRVFKYNLGALLHTPNHGQKLQKDMLVPVCDMHDWKVFLVTTPTPDGKMLAFSSKLEKIDEKCDDEIYDSDFELFDPTTGRWHKLIRISQSWRKERIIISTHAFINNEPVLLLQTQIGVFVGDLRSPYTAFHKVEDALSQCIPGRPSLVIERLCLNAFNAFDFEKDVSFDIPELQARGPSYV